MDRKRRATWWGVGATTLIIAAAIVFGLTCLGRIHVWPSTEDKFLYTELGSISFGESPPLGLRVLTPPIWQWGPGSYTNAIWRPYFERSPYGWTMSIPSVFIWAPLGIAAVLARKKQRRLANPTLCERCGYVTIGVAKCPECGAATTTG